MKATIFKNLYFQITFFLCLICFFNNKIFADLSFDETYKALKNQSLDIIKNTEKKDLDLLVNKFKRSLLIEAFYENDLDLAFVLIENQIAIDTKDIDGNSALHFAAKTNNVEIIEKLLMDISIDTLNNLNQTPLHIAIINNQKEALKVLIKNGSDINAQCKYLLNNSLLSDFFALGFAISKNDIEMIDILLEDERIDTSQNIETIGNILHLAIHLNYPDILKHLLDEHLDKVYDLLYEKNSNELTPLMYAAFLGNAHEIALLKEKGADLDAKDESGKTAIHFATIAKQKEIIELLAYFGADINAVDNNNFRAIDYIKQNTDDESNKIIDLFSKLNEQNQKLQNAPPLYIYNPLENLVLQGGGAKGIAYVGAIQALENLKALDDLKRVCGASAGAIIAAFISLGYDSNEMHEILSITNLTDFLDYIISLKNFENYFKDESFKEILKNAALDIFQIFKHPTTSIENTFKLFESIIDATSLCEGEDFRKWLEEKIYEKTKIKYCTFKELRHLTKTDKRFKHLHVITTQVEPTMKIVQINSEDSKYDDIIISDAIRASMSIPAIFKPHTLYIKNNENKRVKKDDSALFIDGGVLYNYPINAFDALKYQIDNYTSENKDFIILNKKTLGLSLYTPQNASQKINNVNNIIEFTNTLFELYFNSEEFFHMLEPYDEYRTVKINIEDVSTLEFQLTDEEKKKLESSGFEATKKFFKEQEKRLNALNLTITLDDIKKLDHYDKRK